MRNGSVHLNHSPGYQSTLDSSVLGPDETLPLIRALCDNLAVAGVVYCHWKSNDALDRSARGENDLDLLVRRADIQRFTEVLCALGFKEAKLPPTRQMPGVLDYHGLDEASGRLVHVHAHYQLIIGEDMTKNVHLPLEGPYLASATRVELFPMPEPSIELIVFVIRMMLKHATWDTALTGIGKLKPAERRELDYLQTRADHARMHELLKAHLPNINPHLLDRCLDALSSGASLWSRLRAGSQLQRALRAHTRYNVWTDSLLKMGRRGVRGCQRRLVKVAPRTFAQPRKRLTRGGTIIAVVGGDGAGKSTVVDAAQRWLGKQLDVLPAHMGKPEWSWLTIVTRGLLGLVRRIKWADYASFADARYTADGTASFPGYALLLRELCTARDRYRTYAKMRRYATNGGFVVCDRFPLRQIQLMDGPQIPHLVPAEKTSSLIRLLARWEADYYARILSPDLLIVLRLDPEIAINRVVDRAIALGQREDAAAVRLRNQEIWQADWSDSRAYVIDASQSAEHVISELKALIWSRL